MPDANLLRVKPGQYRVSYLTPDGAGSFPVVAESEQAARDYAHRKFLDDATDNAEIVSVTFVRSVAA